MATVSDVIAGALQRINVLAAGETASGAESADALKRLNVLLDRLGSERLNIPFITRTAKAITASTSTYTIGTGGDINIVRPTYIDRINLLDTTPSPDTEIPLTRLTEEGYAGIVSKADTATYPTHWYYDHKYASGLGNIILYPVPTGTTLQMVLYTPTAVPIYSAVTSTVLLPPGYQQMLETNLAVELAAEYGKAVHPSLAKAAGESLRAIKRANFRMQDLHVDPAGLGSGGGWYDIYTGP